MIYLYEDLVGKLDTYEKCKELANSIHSIGVVCTVHGYLECTPPGEVTRWDRSFEEWKRIAIEYFSKRRTMRAIEYSRTLPELIATSEYRKVIDNYNNVERITRVTLKYFSPIFGILRIRRRLCFSKSIYNSWLNGTRTIGSPCKPCLVDGEQMFYYAFSSNRLTFADSTVPNTSEIFGSYQDNLTMLKYL
jgi:hypothetical protein